eukprot:TRINITY_DN3253_c0_g1_i1.p1 TRINITY_DN3253_c0_g1~~TRINITY_DN3253_c0_g1_i1.p1  ORF type:complete len:267 (-),score=53.42 TRINITY_DN3253_c0_g1_i1:111-911(-)
MSDGDEDIWYTIVVPTYEEKENLKPLTERLFAALKKARIDTKSEMIVVDDNSNDGSEEVINSLSDSYNVRIIVRKDEKGLSSAVLRGFDEGRGNILLCMDADLQHPPESVPKVLNTLDEDDHCEFVLGTRYGETGAVDKNWPMYRRVISKGARALALPLSPLSDPMSGFFAIKKTAFTRAKKRGINPIGFKIGLELYVKARIKKHREVEFSFGVREAGFSKLSKGVIIKYLFHLKGLYWDRFGILLIIFLLAALVLVYYLARMVLL